MQSSWLKGTLAFASLSIMYAFGALLPLVAEESLRWTTFFAVAGFGLLSGATALGAMSVTMKVAFVAAAAAVFWISVLLAGPVIAAIYWYVIACTAFFALAYYAISVHVHQRSDVGSYDGMGSWI